MDFDFQTEVIDRLARIETKLEAVADHEKRIRGLERSRWTLGGGIAVISALLTAFIEAAIHQMRIS